MSTTVFLSYARGDDGEPFDPGKSFVARLHADLTAHGFDVWFDRVSMPSRTLTFHQEIRDAIAARERLVLVVGPRAVTSDYVRQEWQFAWFEAEKVVTPIFRLGDYPLPIDELKLLHCEDFRDDAEYPYHLEQLVRILREPAPPLGKLIAVPSLPAHYLTRAERLQALRDALRADLDRPVVIGGAAARVGMHGMGGIGKSVLAAALARDRKVREAFPDGIVWVGLGSLPNLPALMQRVHRDLGGDGVIATEHEGKQRLKELLADKALLLVLDDAWRRSDVDAFDVLGSRCRALVTTRDAGLLTALGGTHHVVELLTDEEARRLLALAAGVAEESLPAEATALVAECGRLPLALALCGALVRRLMPWSSILEQLQKARIDRIAERHAVEPHHQSVWHAIHVSVEALAPGERERFLELGVFPGDETTPEPAIATLWEHTGQLDDWGAGELLNTLAERSLIQMTLPARGLPGGQRRFSLHDLVYDYVQRAIADPAQLHATLLTAYERKCPQGWPSGPDDGYYFTHLRRHLILAGRGEELADLLHELRWLEAKNEAGLTFDLASDFRDVLNALPADNPRRSILGLLEEALRRDINFIARHSEDYPQALFQCLWNSGWWYDSPEVVLHCVQREAGWSDPPPWERPAEKLHSMLERWRAQKEQRGGAFSWVRSLRPPRVALDSPQRAVLGGHEGFVNCIAVTLDGRLIASGSDDTTVRIWNAKNGKELHCLHGHEYKTLRAEARPVCDVAFSPVRSLVASGAQDGKVRVWDLDNGRMLWSSEPDAHEWVTGLAFTLDGEHLYCTKTSPLIEIRKATTGELVKSWQGHKAPIGGIKLSADGRRFATYSAIDKLASVWDVATGRELCTLQGHTDMVSAAAISCDGGWIATASRDGTIRVWDATTGQCRYSLAADGHYAECLAISPDGSFLASGGTDWMVHIWDARHGRSLKALRGHAYGVRGLAFLSGDPGSTSGPLIVSGSMDGTIRIWDPSRPAGPAMKDDGLAFIQAVAFSPNGRYLASADDDGVVTIWNPYTATVLRKLVLGKVAIFRLMFSRSGRHLYINSKSGVLVWRTMSRCPVRTLDPRRTRQHVADRDLAVSDLWNELWKKEMGSGLDPEKVLGGWQSAVPGIPFGPFDVRREQNEMVVRSRSSNRIVARHPGSLYETAWHPSGRIWCGRESSRLNVFTLEGRAEG